ncbi:MAG: hypothetical protein M3P37_12325 [Actinomycetota bacterium]|jgi:hypothetical protein|nr:hypothetical protein [Actinomycetota bacterium]
MENSTGTTLPEVTLLADARGERPENAVGIGAFWYEPEIWSLGLSPAARVLYASLCSYLAHGQINRKDLRATLGENADGEIASAIDTLVRHNLLEPEESSTRSNTPSGYKVRSVKEFE